MKIYIHQNWQKSSHKLKIIEFYFAKLFKDNTTSNINVSNQQTQSTNSQSETNALNETKRNVTKMVIYTSLVFLIGNILGPCVYFFVFVFGLKLENYLLVISLLSNTLLFGSYGLNMFVCYSFNNKFRLELRKFIFIFKFILILFTFFLLLFVLLII